MQRRQIVLTHWNAGVFASATVHHLLPELVVYALLYDEVLIREEDLLTNRHVTELLEDSNNLRFFEEMLASGLVRLLRLPLSQYPEGRRFDPVRLPVSARVEEHQLRRTYKGARWKPTKREWRLFERLDRIVYDNPLASRFHADFPPGNPFAAELADVLEHRESYGLATHPVFGKIHPETAEAFIAFCREPDAWQRFLHDHHVTSFIEGPDGQFFRSAAYQCSKLLPTPRRIQRLVESAYAAAFCSRERAEGRYGGELVELPHRFGSVDERRIASDILIRVEVAPTGAVAQVPIVPGVADALVTARASDSYDDLRRVLCRLGTEDHLPLEAEFSAAWVAVCDVYAEQLARILVPQSARTRAVQTYSVWAYLLARVFGLLVIPHGPFALEGAVLVDHAVEHYGHHLLQSFRGVFRAPSSRERLASAAAIRCSEVPLTPRGNGSNKKRDERT